MRGSEVMESSQTGADVTGVLSLSQFQALVSRYKSINLSISSLCQQISETLLITLDGKSIYR